MDPYVVLGLVTDEEGAHVVLLAPDPPARRARVLVPVWIGPQEAALIAIALGGDTSTRPLTHDLLETLLTALGGEIVRAELACGADDLFDAVVVVASAQGSVRLECRAADAIALAVRRGVPVHVDRGVVALRGIVEETAEAVAEVADDETRVAEFRRYLDVAEPGDFRG